MQHNASIIKKYLTINEELNMNVLLNIIICILCALVGLVIAGILFLALVTTIVYFFRKDNMTIQKNND